METATIQLPKQLFEIVAHHAADQNKTPDKFVEHILSEHLFPKHPYITIRPSRSGPRPMIRGTQIGVDVIVGYHKAGHLPKEIASEILPQLTLSQVYDALGYYEDHRALMDSELSTHSPAAWRTRLIEDMGEDATMELLGE